jgi:hypothetical protein
MTANASSNLSIGENNGSGTIFFCGGGGGGGGFQSSGGAGGLGGGGNGNGGNPLANSGGGGGGGLGVSSQVRYGATGSNGVGILKIETGAFNAGGLAGTYSTYTDAVEGYTYIAFTGSGTYTHIAV